MAFTKISDLYNHFIHIGSVTSVIVTKTSELDAPSVLDQGKTQCQYCCKWIVNKSITRHIRDQHQDASSNVMCQYCNSQYKNESSLSNHLRLKHNVFSK
jgi:hypothetical protein